MTLPPRSLPDLAPPYLTQLEPSHTHCYNAVSTQQLYGPYAVDQTSALTSQVLLPGGQVATTPNHNLQSSILPARQLGLEHFGAWLAGTSQPVFASAAPTGPALPMGPPAQPRKRKAATLRADDWEPYKKRVLDLHIEQKRPLPEVRQIIEKEYGFKAEYVAFVRAGECNFSA